MTKAYYTREYTEKDVLWRLRDQLQLRAVLAPVTGRYQAKSEIPLRARKVQKWWRRAVGRLRKLQWGPVAPGQRSRSRAARRCPMTFLMVHGKPRPCGMPTACPFCWARQAAEWWEAIDDAFFRDARPSTDAPAHRDRAGRAIELDDAPAPRPARKARAHGYKLVTRTRTYRIEPHYTGADGVTTDLLRDFYLARLVGAARRFGGAGADFVRAREIRPRLKEIAAPGRRCGCFENITADLTADKDAWKVSIRQVWLVPEERVLRVITPHEGTHYRERTIVAPWRNQVMKAVAQACRYPKAMLLGPMEGAPAYQLVTARAGLRLAANYGDFRKPHGRDR